MNDGIKVCTKCGGEESVKEFGKNKNAKDGLRWSCKKCDSEYGKEYRQNNPIKVNKARKKWREANFEYPKEYRENNPEKEKARFNKWREDNLGHYRKYHKEYQREKKKNEPIFKLNCNLSNAIGGSLRGNKNGRHWEGLVGYTLDDLKEYLESLFMKGMTWENYGRNGWHIDHIVPISLFNITSVKCKGFRACWALENLRPMWEGENIRKGNKLFI